MNEYNSPLSGEDEAFQKLRASRTRNMIITLAVIVIIFIISRIGGSVRGVGVSIKDSVMTLSGPAGSDTIKAGDIESIDYFENPDFGEAAEGGIEGNWRHGTWKSEELGTYKAYLSKNIAGCILIKTKDEAYALNVESAKTTEIFFDTCSKWRADLAGKE